MDIISYTEGGGIMTDKFTGIVDVENIRGLIETISKMSYEPTIKFREDGIRFEESDGMSPRIIVSVFIPKTIFKGYNLSGNIDIHFRGNILHNNLKRMKGEISIGTDGSVLKLYEMKKDRSYEIRLVIGDKKIDITDQIKKINSYSAEMTTKLNTKPIKEAIADAINIFESKEFRPCTLIFGKQGVILKAEAGDGFNKFEQKIDPTPFGKEVSAKFPLEQLQTAVDLMVDDVAEFQLYQDNPIKIVSEHEGSKAIVVIAPIL